LCLFQLYQSRASSPSCISWYVMSSCRTMLHWMCYSLGLGLCKHVHVHFVVRILYFHTQAVSTVWSHST
jgi:hypothetical protein